MEKSLLLKQKNNILHECQKQIDLRFKNQDLLFQALSHSSSTNNKLLNNERLEFFGDAVLKLIISQYLFEKYPLLLEGDLTKIRSQIVADKNLADLAKKINLGQFLFLSSSENKTNGRLKESNLANAFEALLGAYYLDQGLKKVQLFLCKLINLHQENFQKENARLDYKSRLQEILQQKKLDLPQYRIIKEDGPDHEKIFHVLLEIEHNNKIHQVEGLGSSKKEAEQNTAQKALSLLFKM